MSEIVVAKPSDLTHLVDAPRGYDFDHVLGLLGALFKASQARAIIGDNECLKIQTALFDLSHELCVNVQVALHHRGLWPEPQCPNCHKQIAYEWTGPLIRWRCNNSSCALYGDNHDALEIKRMAGSLILGGKRQAGPGAPPASMRRL